MSTDPTTQATTVLSNLLHKHFQPQRDPGMDVRIALKTANAEPLMLEICNRHLHISPSLPHRPDVTLYFDNLDTAIALFQGALHPVDAFMAHRFRSDGNLVMVFTFLSLFDPRPTSP